MRDERNFNYVTLDLGANASLGEYRWNGNMRSENIIQLSRLERSENGT